jgi:hypothetical protein
VGIIPDYVQQKLQRAQVHFKAISNKA